MSLLEESGSARYEANHDPRPGSHLHHQCLHFRLSRSSVSPKRQHRFLMPASGCAFGILLALVSSRSAPISPGQASNRPEIAPWTVRAKISAVSCARLNAKMFRNVSVRPLNRKHLIVSENGFGVNCTSVRTIHTFVWVERIPPWITGQYCCTKVSEN